MSSCKLKKYKYEGQFIKLLISATWKGRVWKELFDKETFFQA